MPILAALDENERSKKNAQIGYDLATAYDDTLIVLHVIPKEEYEAHKESILSIPEHKSFPISQEEESAKQFAERFVLETLEDPDMEMIEAQGRVGDVTTEILDVAGEIEPRYLVISGRRRSPAGKAVFGSTAQQILLRAECPVVSQFDEGGETDD
jgi:nucleotide-binding universal stress UspA family protein